MLSQFMDKVQTSTTSLASSISVASSEEGIRSLGASMRRLSVPLSKAGRVSQRRFSQMVTAIGEAIDQEVELMSGEKPGPLFGSSLLNREWELVTVSELCRRLSLDGKDLELPIPEGSDKSQILDELMIRQIVETLPPRAMGYPWVNIYSSEKHGFSLATLYRKMVEFDEDLSPVLLIIRDTDDHIFGAIVSGAIRPSDHFVGTGDSCQLWRFTGQAPNTRDLRPYQWTGENQFFVNANKDYLAIGAGSGHYGLWLDADLNHGRSQRCDTFDNELLAGDKEDFIVQYVEAFGFRM
ncbi:unnamed protein product [Auanema sp. JU1783]|nr:unnamed protein product [Auanema sp. JU1783]